MPRAKIFQSLRNLRQELNRMIFDGVSKAGDLGVQFGSDRLHAKPLKRANERMREAVQAVTMRDDALALRIVEHLAHLLGRKLVVIEKRNKLRDGALEVNVVLPQRVVGVDEKG